MMQSVFFPEKTIEKRMEQLVAVIQIRMVGHDFQVTVRRRWAHLHVDGIPVHIRAISNGTLISTLQVRVFSEGTLAKEVLHHLESFEKEVKDLVSKGIIKE